MRERRTFREAIEDLTPWWMRAADGIAVLQSLAIMKDIMMERAQQSVLLRFPSHAPEDALPMIGEDRALPRIEDEAPIDYRSRLLGWRGRWGHRYRGNAFALLRMCLLALSGAMREQGVYSADRRGNLYHMTAVDSYDAEKEAVDWDFDGEPPAPQWARFWLVLYVEAQPFGSWDEMLTAIWTEDQTCSMGAKNWRRSRANSIKGLVSGAHPWKMAGSRAEHALYVLAGDDSFPEPDGTWGRYFGSTKPATIARSRLRPAALG